MPGPTLMATPQAGFLPLDPQQQYAQQAPFYPPYLPYFHHPGFPPAWPTPAGWVTPPPYPAFPYPPPYADPALTWQMHMGAAAAAAAASGVPSAPPSPPATGPIIPPEVEVAPTSPNPSSPSPSSTPSPKPSKSRSKSTPTPPPPPATKKIDWKLNTLLHVHTEPSPPWDLRWPFDASVRALLEGTPSHAFNQPASSPAAYNIRLLNESYPWPVDVVASSSKGITVFQLLDSLHQSMQQPVTPAEFRILSEEDQAKVLAARQTRCAWYGPGMPEEKLETLRIDFLKGEVFLKGLVSDDEAVEKMMGKSSFPRVMNLIMVLGSS